MSETRKPDQFGRIAGWSKDWPKDDTPDRPDVRDVLLAQQYRAERAFLAAYRAYRDTCRTMDQHESADGFDPSSSEYQRGRAQWLATSEAYGSAHDALDAADAALTGAEVVK